ncbi:MAG: DNA-processing protein DprA [Syntrophaceae bacterium]|nr:DNA-processing protein DprA [Syntrophaceae bacterium]
MPIDQPIQLIDRNSQSYPNLLAKRLGKEAPARLWAIGRLDLINIPKTALFCSNRCPGDAILKAMDRAQKWRDQGRCIISGFHSPIEKECLQILLRGRQPITICPARSIENMRIPKDWKPAIEEGRLLVLSPFPAAERRMTTALADQRNKMVAALADEIYIAHVDPDGRIDDLSRKIAKWAIPVVGN